MPKDLPKLQRVAAYAIILRDGHILLTQLASRISSEQRWHLPGGGLDHGEEPREALVREIREETGLEAEVGATARVYSAHLPSAWRQGRRWDYQALRIVYDAWVPKDAPPPHVVEVDGSTVAVNWFPVTDVLSGKVQVTDIVSEALAGHATHQHQRVAAYALIRRGDDVLLTRVSERGFNTGSWTLPGGGVDHGEAPADAVVREVSEECGVTCKVGRLLTVHDVHFDGTAPTGMLEDFHGIHLIFEAGVDDDATPHVAEVDGTTDAVGWFPVSEVEQGLVEVLDVVRAALAT